MALAEGKKRAREEEGGVRKAPEHYLRREVGEAARLDACRDGLTHSERRRASAGPTKAGDGD